ncbi:MAG: hypothetical protein ACI8QT_001140 [Halioglobus sp.]|jgi:hypothetical protein
MKTFTSFAVSMVLASAALPSMAGTHDRENLAQCKSELRKVFGDTTTMKLKSIKRSRDGAQMRIKTIPSGSESQMVTCWVDSEGATNMVDKQGVALAAPEYKAEDKVSMND